MSKPTLRCHHCNRLLFLVYSPVHGWIYVHPSRSSGRRCRSKQAEAENQKLKEATHGRS